MLKILNILLELVYEITKLLLQFKAFGYIVIAILLLHFPTLVGAVGMGCLLWFVVKMATKKGRKHRMSTT